MNNWESNFKISFTKVVENKKYLGINLMKYVHNLYTENYKTLLKEILKNLNREMYHNHGSEDSILF